MHQNNIFFIFLKLFFRLTHQNNLKYKKKINTKNKILNFLKTQVNPRFQMLSAPFVCWKVVFFFEK